MAHLSNSLSNDRAAPYSGDQKVNDGPLMSSRSGPVLPLAKDPAEGSDAVGTLTRQLNGSLTALMLYMGEIKQRSDEIARTPGERRHVQMIVDNALLQTERVCALVSQISGAQAQLGAVSRVSASPDDAAARVGSSALSGRANKALTPREREVLKLISDGHSNKEGALRMGISPRTFESHRAEAMRKLGARNTAELVRAALLNQIA
ncbi:response regulator transcription factor [Bradyrhizobium sp. HKCCYLS20291]|uniref:response regulator transcription factor n=1 Tax=Bradyrhizobium sp. HKCCYLS20291 TaxID=3420766 RepID=UPI003EBF0534